MGKHTNLAIGFGDEGTLRWLRRDRGAERMDAVGYLSMRHNGHAPYVPDRALTRDTAIQLAAMLLEAANDVPGDENGALDDVLFDLSGTMSGLGITWPEDPRREPPKFTRAVLPPVREVAVCFGGLDGYVTVKEGRLYWRAQFGGYIGPRSCGGASTSAERLYEDREVIRALFARPFANESTDAPAFRWDTLTASTDGYTLAEMEQAWKEAEEKAEVNKLVAASRLVRKPASWLTQDALFRLDEEGKLRGWFVKPGRSIEDAVRVVQAETALLRPMWLVETCDPALLTNPCVMRAHADLIEQRKGLAPCS